MKTKTYRQIGLITFILALFLSGCKKSDVTPGNNYEDVEYGRFRGFNLLGKFDVEWSNPGYSEWDFQMIRELGFNFVRLPIDYRTFTASGDWNNFSEKELTDIDNAIFWGLKYNIHVNLNLHRAPGYCVNKINTLPANQDLDLWTNQAAREAFVRHWAMFAERYKDIPAGALSFNLVNEPTGVSSAVYSSIAMQAIDAIKKFNPARVVHVDGLDTGNTPVEELVGVNNVVQSLHNYRPFTLTHYYASWVTGSNSWLVPQWPLYNMSNGLYGSWKPELKGPFTIEGNFSENTVATIQVNQVSVKAEFFISLGNSVIYSHLFEPADGDGEWEQVISTQWGYQNIYNRDYSITLPVDGENLHFFLGDGDWLTFNKITIETADKTIELLPGNAGYGIKPTPLKITTNGEVQLSDGSSANVGSPLIEEWSSFSKTKNVPIMVGECGVYNHTPHDVTLLYLEDMLMLMEENDIGYALWNFRGSFGIFDSDRKDISYENYNGHQLDRKMLDLLQKY